MITTIRNQFKSSTYRYIVFFIVFVIAFGMVSTMLIRTERVASAAWAVKVNGKEISYRDFAQEAAQQAEFLNRFRAQYGQYADMIFQSMGWKADPKSLALDILVKQELISQYAKKLGIHLHADYIAQSVNDQAFAQQHLAGIVPAFVFNQSGALDADILQAYLRQNGLSMKDFEHKIEQALTALQVMSFVAASLYVPQFDSTQEYIAKKLGKKFAILTFNFDKFLSEQKKIAVSDEDLQTFYDAQNKQFRRYWVAEKRNGITWKCVPSNYGIVISEDEIKHYYEENKLKLYVADPIKIEVRQITQAQIAAHDATMSLEAARQELIANPDSSLKSHWKTLAPFARNEKKGAFERAAFLLQNEGEISPVVETKEGKVIVQLVKRIARTYKPLATVKNEIKNSLIGKKFNKNFAQDIKKITLENDKAAIEAFIAQKVGKKEHIADVIKDETRLSQELFALHKGDYGFYMDGDTGVIVTLTDVQERNLPALAAIKEAVKADYYEIQAKKAMDEQMSEVFAQSETATFDDLHKKFTLPLEYTEMISPTDSKKNQALEKKGLPIHEMLGLEKEGSVFAHAGERNSFLVKLDTIEKYDENQLLIAQKEINEHFGFARTKLYLESFVASLHRNATIETNEIIFMDGEKYSE